MTRRIVWKHVLPIAKGSFDLELPRGCRLLSLGVQDGEAVLWEEHWPGESVTETVCFHARDTGQEFEHDGALLMSYVGTVQLPGAIVPTFVRHVWVELQ